AGRLPRVSERVLEKPGLAANGLGSQPAVTSLGAAQASWGIEHRFKKCGHLSNPLVTIGITAFNAEDTVARALSSALAQTWQPFEIVVVDDASTDKTRSVIEAIAARYDIIRVVSNMANSGVASARNQIINRAKGEFLVFFDDDDVSRPNRVERQLN